MRKGDRPIAGTRLIREWQGVEHCATVLDDGFEYQGRPIQVAVGDCPRHHRHAVERAAIFGLRNYRSAEVKAPRVRSVPRSIPASRRKNASTWNSTAFDAQREAATPTFQSQKHEGWILVGDRYDDGGLSGGSYGATGAAAAAARR